MKVNLSNYRVFLSYIDSITNLFTDIDIRNNELSQLSSDKSTIVYGNLSSVFPEPLDLRLVSIKSKLPLLKMFEKSFNGDDSISVSCADNNVKISDTSSEITLRQASPEFINNQYLSIDEIKRKLIIEEDKDEILSVILSSTILDRINTISHNFNSMNLDFNIENKKCGIHLVSSEKTDRATIINDLDCVTDKKLQITFSVIPFQTKFDGIIDTKLYYKEIEGKRISIMKLNTNLKGIDTSVYIKGTII
ncbi:hypothetical protein M0R36_09630 [bacterium]|jgi:hypothetical protein|nr:hypothetical protein [bacterium]